MNPTDAIQLTSWNTHLLLPLFQALTPRLLQAEAALTGQTRCSLYVDHVEEPQAAALRIGICWYVAGNPNPGFLRSINKKLSRDTFSVLILDPSITESQRAVLLDDLYFVEAKSRYAVRTNPNPVMHSMPESYRALPIDRALLEGNLEGAAEIRADIVHFWTSMEVYDRDGFGYAIIKDVKIVSHSVTSFAAGERCEIGVQTDPAHRRKGLGACVASLTANEAFARGLIHVGWMSWANNTGSVAISERAGFTEECVYDVYINHWPAGNPGDLSQEEFRAFAMEYKRQFAAKPPSTSGYPHLVAATAWDLAGDDDACRDHLHCAIDMGWLKTLDQLRELWPELFQSPNVFRNAEWMDVFSRLQLDENSK